MLLEFEGYSKTQVLKCLKPVIDEDVYEKLKDLKNLTGKVLLETKKHSTLGLTKLEFSPLNEILTKIRGLSAHLLSPSGGSS